MNEVIVSVRMPESMLTELKSLSKKNHFLDVSEELRSIIRDKAVKYSSPYNADLRKVIDDLQQEIASRETTRKKKVVIDDLRRLLEELEHE
ncbi:MAG: ribbon-helix-helix domain-containing protein [Nanoarchaeota archaeon]|nr:ribbon-helix-helix domain-containing protein [Nanoarchaeota archaeon]